MNIVIGQLEKLTQDVLCHGVKSISEVPEFSVLAKYLGIGKIVRTISFIGDENNCEIYSDDTVNAIYSKKIKRANDDSTFVYTYYLERAYTDLPEDDRKVFELLTNVLCMCYSCAYTLEAQRMLSHIDRETGIPNSKGFRAFYNKVNSEGRLSDYAVIRANVKGCNVLNNLFGYQATTDIIVKYAQKLNTTMDTDEICSRQGSDNFCIMVKKEHLSDHLANFSKLPIDFYYGKEKTIYTISLRAGIVKLDNEETDINTILARAESCLDVARRKSEQDIVYYDKNAIKRELELIILESEMPEALNNNEFVVYYQPKVRIDNRTLTGAEALIRWNKNGKLISPMDFIPIAEHTGFIRHLDMFVLEHTCRLLKKWKNEGKRIVPVSVNFSKIHLRFPHLAEKIMRVLNRYDIEPSYIEIEFTETAYTDDFNAIKKAIDDLKGYGVVVSMDDFGTGYSSLALLKDLDFNVLKLDKSLTSNKDDGRGRVVLENVLHMANELSMETVCEGVEDKSIVEKIRKMGCNIIQGYYFDRPLPEKEFEERIMNPVYQK
ncbi:MAG: EAL domain-containing protein [Ruminiclostridium sp.]|nr:EAL domain-containing protein [Ruminiclostridium sp.]